MILRLSIVNTDFKCLIGCCEQRNFTESLAGTVVSSLDGAGAYTIVKETIEQIEQQIKEGGIK